ncbi:hypothetical protein HPT25_20230 [Bacillus sp. BRMEA1]|uniref:hypothetical protein n=1 Tax=Neobacillus endophyticus TaxID=2738405 RepID=UPI001563D816|nr:hypothetical protein [Neobacillus endophyticus]NRD79693.1 hypothetical protein [Neobacillus endophyticus]
MFFIAVIIIIVLVYFLIIRPLTNRNRPQIYDSRRGYYERPDYYGPPNQTEFGRLGTFAGGMAAGALLTFLFEQGRIGFDQFNALQNLEDHEIMRELMDQNIIQEHEIDRLQDELNQFQGDNQGIWDDRRRDDPDNIDYNDQNDFQNGDDVGGWDNNDDNWV